MASENEPAKVLLPYLQRADELQKHELLVAYYCRLYAMERGLKISQNERTKTTNSLLISIMNQLEKDKKTLKLGPEDNLYLEGFALNVFGKADKQDRAGKADLNTAKTFYAASIFFEILNQFGTLQPDLEEKQKYSVWKAADIRKALKEGRNPTPGPPSGDDDLSIPPSATSGSYDIQSSEHPRVESDPLRLYDSVNNQHSTDIPPSYQHPDEVNNQHSSSISESFQYQDEPNSKQSTKTPSQPHHYHDDINSQHSGNPSSSHHSYPAASYPSHQFHPPPTNITESSDYPQPYHHNSYTQEPEQNFPPNYPSHETASHPYPHFQQYPSFTQSSLPAVPPQYHSYHQGSDAYNSQQSPPTTSYPSTAEFQPSSGNGCASVPVTTSAKTYEYDNSYQPPPEKIAEAHKAARFAVGALAFDDVSVAVDYLRKSLELLTNPSAAQ